MKGWKTITFNVLTAILLVVEQMGLGFGLTPETIAAITLIGNGLLRFVTDTKVFSSVAGIPGGAGKKPPSA